MGVGSLVIVVLIVVVILAKVTGRKPRAGAPRWIPIEVRVTIPPEEYDQDHEIISPSSGERHTVNLHRLVCSCPDQQKRRRFHRGDLRRHCTHLNERLSAKGFTKKMHPMAAAVIDGGCTIGRRMEMFQVPASEEPKRMVPVLIVVSDSNDWAHVFGLDDTGVVRQFEFDVHEKRWVDGAEPVAADRIGKYILSSIR